MRLREGQGGGVTGRQRRSQRTSTEDLVSIVLTGEDALEV